jgi:hypothetical protein
MVVVGGGLGLANLRDGVLHSSGKEGADPVVASFDAL